MTTPISQRIFGLNFRAEPIETVEDLVERLRRHDSNRKRVVVAKLSDTVEEAYQLFTRFRLHHLPVVAGAVVVGVVSESDLLHFYANDHGDPQETSLEEVMTCDPHVIACTAPLAQLIHMLANANFRCLPVVSRTNEIWDIVTTHDLVEFLELSYE